MKLLVQESVNPNLIKESEPIILIKHMHSLHDLIEASGRILLPITNGYQCCLPDDILYLKAESNYTEIFFRDGSKRLLSKTLKILEKMLPSHRFYRVHKSYLVNTAHITDIILSTKERAVKLVSGHILPMRRDWKQILLV